jgi:acyl dehydratase
MSEFVVGGPYFNELTPGQLFDTAPGITLTDGMAATRQAIIGDRLRLSLDRHLFEVVTGTKGTLAHPGLVWDVAIGQSTLATHHVKANLFYRGLQFHSFPRIGDTLYTRTEVVGLRENSIKPGRPPTGLAALRMTSTDQNGRVVLDFYRCAMLPLHPNADPSRVVYLDDLAALDSSTMSGWTIPLDWDIGAYRNRTRCGRFDTSVVGSVFHSSGDVVSSAPELARLSLNLAAVHHDERVSGQRLVYGGHTIGIAMSQANRALPDMLGVLGWQSCDHTGPVSEEDTLVSELHVIGSQPVGDGAAVDLRSIVRAHSRGTDRCVLDWRFTALVP